MEIAMTEKALNSLLALEISQETMQTIQQHPLYPQMLQLCKMMTRDREQEIMKLLETAPLKILQHLEVMAVCHKMKEPLIIIDNAIQENLQAQREADKAEQKAERAEQWARGLKNLRQSMESRYKQMRQS